MTTEIILLYRDWILTVTDTTATGDKFDGSGERFEIGKLTDALEALRAGRDKVERLEGPQRWNESYTNEALR